MTQQPRQRESLTLLEIAQAWLRGDLYARLWLMLYNAGRVAHSPLEARAKMRAGLEGGRLSGDSGHRSEMILFLASQTGQALNLHPAGVPIENCRRVPAS